MCFIYCVLLHCVVYIVFLLCCCIIFPSWSSSCLVVLSIASPCAFVEFFHCYLPFTIFHCVISTPTLEILLHYVVVHFVFNFSLCFVFFGYEGYWFGNKRWKNKGRNSPHLILHPFLVVIFLMVRMIFIKFNLKKKFGHVYN